MIKRAGPSATKPRKIAELLTLWSFSICFLLSSSVSFGAQTKLVFEVPEVPKAPFEDYPSTQMLEVYKKEVSSPRMVTYHVDAIRYGSLKKSWAKTYAGNTSIHKYFQKHVAAQKPKLEAALSEQIVAGNKMVNGIEYLNLGFKAVRVELSSRNSKINFSLSNLSFDARAALTLHGGERVLCGRHPWGHIKGQIFATGSYDPVSGHASVDRIDMSHWVDVDCTTIGGKAFDHVVDWAAKYLIGKELNKVIEPILDSTVKLVSINDLFNLPSETAQRSLGINFVEDVWKPINQFTDGFTIGMVLGVDTYGKNQHLLKFFAHRNPVPFTTSNYWKVEEVIEDRGKWGTNRTVKNVLKTAHHFVCPIWARSLNTYRVIPLKTGERRKTVRVSKTWKEEVTPIYGKIRLQTIPFGSLSFNSRYDGDFGEAANCTDYFGLSSYLQFQSLGIMNISNYK